MERQFNLVLDVNLELELIQIDFDGMLDLLDHYQVPRFKINTNKSRILGAAEKILTI
jgi:hypothetical protein